MGLTQEEWAEKKSQLSNKIKEEISRKIIPLYSNTQEEWELKKSELDDNGVYVEYNIYQEILIEKIMKQYDIKIEGDLLKDFQFAMSWDEESAREVYLTPDYELSKLVSFLRQSFSCNSELIITSTIKGVKNKIEIKHEINLNNLYLLCDSLLYSKNGGIYQREFGWEEKASYYSQHKDDIISYTLPKDGTEKITYDDKIDVFAGVVDPYSEIELKKIIDYEHEYLKDGIIGYKELRKTNVRDMVLKLREEGIFDTSYKTISTKEACFLFDVMVELETIPHDLTLNNQEKYQYIKRVLLN